MKFNDTYGRNSVMTGALRKQNQKDFARRSTGMYLRETGENKYYRLRLLSFEPDEEFTNKNDYAYFRDHPFILRYVHEVWQRTPDDKAPNGVRISHKSIPCPQSDYIKANSNLTKSACPICSAGNQAYVSYKDSGFKNPVAKQKMKDCHNTFEALVPVIVITDPNNDSNNGSAKVLTLSEEQYERLDALINEARRSNTPIWNDNAVDLYLTYGKVEKVLPARGNNPEYRYKANDIIKMGFTSTPHEVKGLEDLVSELHFDENWFIVPTLEELESFYSENIASAGVDVPDDIPNDIPGASAPPPKVAPPPVKEVKTPEPPKPVQPPKDDIPDDIPAEPPVAKKKVTAPPKEEPPKVEESTQNEASIDKDIDDFINGLSIK